MVVRSTILVSVGGYPVLRVRGLGLEKKNSRMLSLHFLPGKVCWPVNNEVADNRGRKYTIGGRNFKTYEEN